VLRNQTQPEPLKPIRRCTQRRSRCATVRTTSSSGRTGRSSSTPGPRDTGKRRATECLGAERRVSRERLKPKRPRRWRDRRPPLSRREPLRPTAGPSGRRMILPSGRRWTRATACGRCTCAADNGRSRGRSIAS